MSRLAVWLIKQNATDICKYTKTVHNACFKTLDAVPGGRVLKQCGSWSFIADFFATQNSINPKLRTSNVT